MFRNKKNNLWFTLTAVFIILISFSLRIYSPQSDLPPDISISGSVYTDEGNQCHNSRSKVLFDEWFPDEWKITNYNPIVPYFKLLIFKVFGTGLIQVRSVSFFFSLLSLIFFFLILRSYFSSWLSIAGITLLGFNFLYIMYNRIGTFETPMIFWMILSLYFLEKYRVRGKNIFTALSGTAAFMAFVFKMTGAHIIPVPVISLLLFLLFIPEKNLPDRKKIAVSTAVILIAIIISFAIWLLFFYIPNKEWIKSAPGSYIGNQMFPKSIDQLFGNILSYNWKEQFFKMWVVWVAAILYLPIFFRRLLMKLMDITEAGFVLFLLSHTGALMIMNHRPTRYLIAAIPPMVFLTILLFRHVMNGFKYQSDPGILKKSLFLMFDTGWLFLSLFYCFLPLLAQADIHILPVKFSLDLFLISVFLTGLFHLFLYLLKRFFRTGVRIGIFVVVLVLFFVSISIYTNVKYYYHWQRDKTEYVNVISTELGDKLTNGYIAGLTAPVAVLGTEHKSLFLYPKFVHWEKDTLEKYGITHALLANFNFEISNFFGQWPGKMENALLLNVYNVKDQFLHLYSFNDPVISRIKRIDPGTLELSILYNGEPGEIQFGKLESIRGEDIRFDEDPYQITLLPGTEMIKSGENILRISDKYRGSEKLIFIHNKKWDTRFRYEAEKFPKKRGKVVRDVTASGKHIRYFNVLTDRKGFMACSIGGKFIPYTEGMIYAKFYLRFGNIKSRIRPLATIDIFNNTDGIPVSSNIIKKKDIIGEDVRGYPLLYKVKGVSDLEFRVHAEKSSDIYYDYLELFYYQGKFIDGN